MKKNRKNFIILLIVTFLLYGYCFLLVEYKNVDAIKRIYKNNVAKQSVAYIHRFNARFENNKIFFDWDMDIENSSIKSMKLYSNDQYLANVTHLDEYSISIFDSNILTGDNYVKLLVELTDGKKYEKTADLYIKEVFNFQVLAEQVDDNTINYQVDYYYKANKPVQNPNVEYKFKPDMDGEFKLDSSNSENLGYNVIHVRNNYTMKLSNVKKDGIGTIKTYWKFNEYNIMYKNTYDLK